MDLNNSKLEVRGKLMMPDGGNIATGTRVVLVTLPLHSLFSSVNMKIGEKVDTESNNLYPYRAHMETIINYQEDLLKTRMLCEGMMQTPLVKWMPPTQLEQILA